MTMMVMVMEMLHLNLYHDPLHGASWTMTMTAMIPMPKLPILKLTIKIAMVMDLVIQTYRPNHATRQRVMCRIWKIVMILILKQEKDNYTTKTMIMMATEIL